MTTSTLVLVPRDLTGDTRAAIADILETIARDGLPGPRDLDVALDAIGCAITDGAPEAAPPSKELVDAVALIKRAFGAPGDWGYGNACARCSRTCTASITSTCRCG